MRVFWLRRGVQAIGLLMALSFVTFLSLALAPGDPFATLEERPFLSPETRQAWRRQWGLDQPLLVRYGRWLAHVAQGQLGYSLEYQMPVSELIGARLGATLLLTIAANGIAWGIGFPLGVFAALHAYSWFDRAHTVFATVALTTPRFFLALVALIFAMTTGWFPLGGIRSIGIEGAAPLERFLDVLHHLVLPAVVLSAHPLAVISTHTRGHLLDALHTPGVRAARAKGLPRVTLLWRHALRPALAPVIVLVGYSFGSLLSGSALVETILAWPGLGQLIVESVFARDPDVLMATVLIGGACVIVGHTLADALLMMNDPRSRIEA